MLRVPADEPLDVVAVAAAVVVDALAAEAVVP